MRRKKGYDLQVKQISYSDIQPNIETRRAAVIDDSFSDRNVLSNYSIRFATLELVRRLVLAAEHPRTTRHADLACSCPVGVDGFSFAVEEIQRFGCAVAFIFAEYARRVEKPLVWQFAIPVHDKYRE